MANPERGEVGISVTRVVNGRDETFEYTLKLSMNAAVALQNKRKKTMSAIMAEVESLDFATIRDIAHMLLQKHHAKEFDTPEKAGDLIDEAGGLIPFFDAFRALMATNETPPSQEGSANPQPAQIQTGDGSMSMPAVAV